MSATFKPESVVNEIALISARIQTVAASVIRTCLHNDTAVQKAVELLALWMKEHTVIRFLGAGRALQATIMPSNRLAHGGAQISHLGGLVPMPPAVVGGGIVACSASGETKSVLEAMKIAKERNAAITILGFSKYNATEFAKLCDIFVGIHVPDGIFSNPLSALADTEEYVMSELLDALAVLAGHRNGYVDKDWRCGHEDIGPTGPHYLASMPWLELTQG